MEGRLNLSRREREALREEWLLRSGKAFERMFSDANQEQLVTFTEREDMACLLGKELSAFLLEKHLTSDSQVRSREGQPPTCPKCHQEGERVTKRTGKLPERDLTSRAGAFKLGREQWRCRKCRVVFFSAGSKAEVRDGEIQSPDLADGGSAGQQGGIV